MQGRSDAGAAGPQAAPRPGLLARRQRTAIVTGLLGASALAWLELLRMSFEMDAAMAAGVECVLRPWSAGDAGMNFLMWAVMMVGMMVPSAVPMSLFFAQVSRRAAAQGAAVAPTFVFAAGYVAVWTLFSAGATAAQWALERAALLSPMLASASPLFGGALLLAAGLYQWTPAKDACLEHCRAPAHFLARHWRPGARGAFRLGVVHGGYCLGCCWLLMGLLFFGGVMNLLWVAGLTLFVLLEKLVPRGVWLGRLAGLALIAAGAAQLRSAFGA